MTMHARSLATFVLAAALASPAYAGPPKKDPPYGPAKPNKKQVEIEKHERMAEYYVMKANDLDSAEKEYKATLALDADTQRASFALASLYMRGGKGKLAVDV